MVERYITTSTQSHLLSSLVYKNFFDEQKYCEAYYARDIERDLALKKHHFVALAMLLGGDYTDGVKGVGIGKEHSFFILKSIYIHMI